MQWLRGVWLSIRRRYDESSVQYATRTNDGRNTPGLVSTKDNVSVHHESNKSWPTGAVRTGWHFMGGGKTQRSITVVELRCERCRCRRSPAYHYRHWQDPGRNPAMGICSRRRTGCASAKEIIQRGGRIQKLAELPDSGSIRGQGPKDEQMRPSTMFWSG